ncbi:MAG: hypothetical protein K2I70_02550 [Bacilli bacterium]|nr:hypothetical protein [Bacilli bacterium]
MSLIDKLTSIKETILENFEEYEIIKDMTAQEIAKRYGYEKLLSHIRFNLVMSRTTNNEDKIETEDMAEKETVNPSILINIKRGENNTFTICEEGFGAKETYNLNVVRFMLKKYGADTSIGTIDGSEDEYLRIEMLPPKPTIEKRLEELYENKDEYLDKFKDKAAEAKQVAGNAIKKSLNNLANWANNNL